MRNESTTAIAGIDFSAARDGGRRTWIAVGTLQRSPRRSVLRISDVFPAESLPGSGRLPDTYLPALVRWIGHQQGTWIGCDFPFSLPSKLIDGDWKSFAMSFASRYADPDSFRQSCFDAMQGEIRRVSERETKTPFAAYNRRIYRQTYHGIRDVLGPLVIADRARILPMQKLVARKPKLMEVCPASLLKRAGVYRPYKGKLPHLKDERAGLVESLSEMGHHVVKLKSPAVKECLVEQTGGDALDAVLAAIAAADAVSGDHASLHADPLCCREGYVYL